ncbi:MAG: hypothetical protein J5602_12640, partial [Clostridia bacterium]|nr:hypothetical protein [Clostridia bacterium]
MAVVGTLCDKWDAKRPREENMDSETLVCLCRLAPDLMEDMRQRAAVMERISALQPVGRRALSQRLRLPEREIRAICDRLKDDGFLAVAASGMTLSEKGASALPGARELVHSLSGLAALEHTLTRTLNVGRVCVVPGDADKTPEVLFEAGRVAARHLTALLRDGMTLTVSGGTSVAAVAQAMPRGVHKLN